MDLVAYSYNENTIVKSALNIPIHKFLNTGICMCPTFFSEISNFFTEKSAEAAISVLSQTLSGLSLREKDLFGKETRFNSKYSLVWVLSILIMFPCMMVKNPYDYSKSSVGKLCGAAKDVFYRFLNNDSFDWRRIMNHITKQLWKRVCDRSDHTGFPVCVIVDDTDYPKRGLCSEKIGRVFSHVSHKMILGFKSLVLAISDGRSQMVIDCELIGEPGKNGNHSMTEKEIAGRYDKKKRDAESAAAKRIENYTKSKIELLKEMVKRAIRNGYRFDYVLADSWFVCKEILRFVKTRSIGCHYLGMIKMGEKSLRFSFDRNGNNDKYSSKALIAKYASKKGCLKTCRIHRCQFIAVDAFVDDIPVRIFYVRSGVNAPWSGIITTDTDIKFAQAYKIYSMRWSIEVIFKDCKQNLGLGKCQSRDFSAQIAHSSITFIQYNILSDCRRFSNYETIGGLFKDICQDSMELTVCERIWQIICEIADEFAEAFEISKEQVIEKIILDSEYLSHISELCGKLNVA